MRIVSQITRKPYISEMDLLRLQKALLMCRMAADSTFLVDKQPPGYSSKLEYLGELLGRAVRRSRTARRAVLRVDHDAGPDRAAAGRPAAWTTCGWTAPCRRRSGSRLVNRFCEDPRCRLFITTNAGSTGLNLQAANTVINVDLPWNPAVLEQRIGRAHRMGQKRPVQVYVLVTEETIEENLLATLSAKHDLALAALDAESEVTQVDLASGVEELRRRLEVLLGARPEAPVDVAAGKTNSAARPSSNASIATAWRPPGGELLGAVFQSARRAGFQGPAAAPCPGDDRQPGAAAVGGLRRGRSLGPAAIDDHASRPPGAGSIGPHAGDAIGSDRWSVKLGGTGFASVFGVRRLVAALACRCGPHESDGSGGRNRDPSSVLCKYAGFPRLPAAFRGTRRSNKSGDKSPHSIGESAHLAGGAFTSLTSSLTLGITFSRISCLTVAASAFTFFSSTETLILICSPFGLRFGLLCEKLNQPRHSPITIKHIAKRAKRRNKGNMAYSVVYLVFLGVRRLVAAFRDWWRSGRRKSGDESPHSKMNVRAES